MVPAVLMRWLFPVIVVLAVYLFMRGHDLPGGGFVAGLVMAIAFILQYIVSRHALGRGATCASCPCAGSALGLLLSATTGLGSWLLGYPFLTTHSAYLRVAADRRVPRGTALLFDTRRVRAGGRRDAC